MLRDQMKGIKARVMKFKAREYIQKSCDQGHPASFFYLGMIHELGIGVTANLAKAVECYETSRQKGDPQASFKLAMMAQEKGENEKFFELMKESAEKGLLEAQHNLGCYYLEKGESIRAVAWFLNSAKFDFYPSVINIGNIFLNGKDPILANPVAAMIWFKRAQKMEDSPFLQHLIGTTHNRIRDLSEQVGNLKI